MLTAPVLLKVHPASMIPALVPAVLLNVPELLNVPIELFPDLVRNVPSDCRLIVPPARLLNVAAVVLAVRIAPAPLKFRIAPLLIVNVRVDRSLLPAPV